MKSQILNLPAQSHRAPFGQTGHIQSYETSVLTPVGRQNQTHRIYSQFQSIVSGKSNEHATKTTQPLRFTFSPVTNQRNLPFDPQMSSKTVDRNCQKSLNDF